MSELHVVGIGLSGWDDLTDATRAIVERATLLVGSDRHLSYVTHHPAPRLVLTDLAQGLTDLKAHLADHASQTVVILASGDPLFFGVGRLVLATFPTEQLFFHPHLSSVQLAFNRLKVPWHDAQVLSVHGRTLDALIQPLQRGVEKLAILTDATHSPAAIARLFLGLEVISDYQFWVCENLGGTQEHIQMIPPEALVDRTFAPLNVVILLRRDQASTAPLDLTSLPILGLPDHNFLSFRDRPGLITKREVRVLALTELELHPHQVIWDIGAGTGSVAIEMARLVPEASIFAIEKTAVGYQLIQQNCRRFQVDTITVIHGSAPAALSNLPSPCRIFIGGSGGYLVDILNYCHTKLRADGLIVMAIATLEHLHLGLNWCQQNHWSTQILQAQLSRSAPVASLTRLLPLNPVTLLKARRKDV